MMTPQWTLAQSGEDSWDGLRQLRVGQRIEVVTAKLKSVQGSFTGYFDQAVSLRLGQDQVSIPLQDLTGRAGAEVIRQMMEGARKPASGILATTLGLATLFLGATAVVAELRDALNTVWEIPIQQSPWARGVVRILKERVFSFVMVLGVGFLLLVSLIVNVWLAAAGAFFNGFLPMPESVLQALTSAVSFVVIAGLFALIYKVMPDVDLEWRDVAAGAALTSLLFSLGKLVIGFYLGKTGLGSTYGAAGSLVVLLVWVYCSAQVFLLGAEFTQVFARRYGSNAIRGPATDCLTGQLPVRSRDKQTKGSRNPALPAF
jgi:membrane protein